MWDSGSESGAKKSALSPHQNRPHLILEQIFRKIPTEQRKPDTLIPGLHVTSRTLTWAAPEGLESKRNNDPKLCAVRFGVRSFCVIQNESTYTENRESVGRIVAPRRIRFQWKHTKCRCGVCNLLQINRRRRLSGFVKCFLLSALLQGIVCQF